MSSSITIQTPSGAYEVQFASDSLNELGGIVRSHVTSERCFVVTDQTVWEHWGSSVLEELNRFGIEARTVILPPGEAQKTPQNWLNCVAALIEKGLERTDFVVAVGGGVVGDMAGFAAATALRGVPWIQVPTTLLAMVDSSVGGKTGVNLSSGKNLLGAFHHPKHVFISTQFLTTLSDREFLAGCGEIVKSALLEGPKFWNWLMSNHQALRNKNVETVREAVQRCVALKGHIVGEDAEERGLRKLLNAGHTLGHALENAMGYGALLHGEAVGIGLLAEAKWAVGKGICTELELPDQITTLLLGLGLPVGLQDIDESAILNLIQFDKKARNGKLLVPVPVSVGNFRMEWISQEHFKEFVASLKL